MGLVVENGVGEDPGSGRRGMRAWTINHAASGGLVFRDVAEPVAARNEAIIAVRAFAPNPGDLAALNDMETGTIPGWDGSGVVLRSAEDGTGPQVGSKVIAIGLQTHGWAQRRAVPTSMIGLAPTQASIEHLAMLPVPATSALRAVRRLGSILGRRVLISGATSAVGRFAVQLAARSGARVTAVARDRKRSDELCALGADEVHQSLSSVNGLVDGAIDLIGGQHLVDTYAKLRAGAVVIALGHAAHADERFPYGSFVAGPETANRTITSFFLGAEPNLAREMTWLAHQDTLDVGDLDVHPWTELAEWVRSGAPRRSGRVVFAVDAQDAQ